jgi:Raf kinase inhibitor-like YbhB/YbcL family protein
MANAAAFVAVGVVACGSATSPNGPSAGAVAASVERPSPQATPSLRPRGSAASPGSTALPTASTTAPSPGFALTTAAFPVGGEIPARFTCDGEDLSPDVAWSGAPEDAGALVLVVDDPDASGFVHWIMFNLPGAASGAVPIGISTSPHPPSQGTNDFGTVGWRGPCPPSGEHRYRFTLSALDAPLRLTGAPDAATIREALAAATVLGTATLEGRYRRP